jgi:predicted O-methyltransferase YrrM
MKDRIVLAEYFKDKGFTVGAEIGVASGYYSAILCQKNPKLKLYCIDPWLHYRDYKDFANKKTFETMEMKAKELLSHYNTIIMKSFSVDAVKAFVDESLDFVFIDGNHTYDYVKEDIEVWTPKVRKGGIVSGHDYYKTKAGNVGVIKAVDEYVKEHGYKLKLTRWNQSNYRDDRQPCWYFTKI